MKKKLTKRQIQAKNTRQKIYNISIDLMKKKGFNNITIAEICSAANVSIGSFYNYFESKYSILDEIFKIADDFFLDVVTHNIKGNTTQDQIVEYFCYYADFNVDRGIDFIKQLYTVKNNLFATKGRHMQAVLQNIIENGQKNGDITTEMTAEEIVDYLFISVRGAIYNWCLHDGEYDLTQFIDRYVRRLIKSII